MTKMEAWANAVEKVTKELKARFPNLTTEETVKLALTVVRLTTDALDEAGL